MALREFADAGGVVWYVWEVTPETMHPLSARDALGAGAAQFRDGWLVFESERERRRLPGYPPEWSTFPPAALERLLARAERVTARRSAHFDYQHPRAD